MLIPKNLNGVEVGNVVSFKYKGGRRVQINVTVWLDSVRGACYDIFIMVCEPKKRKFVCVADEDSWHYRGLTKSERIEYKLNQYLQYVTPVEIQATKEELWEILKPTT